MSDILRVKVNGNWEGIPAIVGPPGEVQYEDIAATFSSASNYSAGDYIYYSGNLYRFTSDHSAGAWSASDVTPVKIGEEIESVKEEIDSVGLTAEIKAALIACFEKVAWIDGNGRSYVSALYAALNNRYWQITNNLSNCSTNNGATQVIKENPYSATIAANAGYTLTGANVSVTMGGVDITSTAYNNGTISILSVTGALVISVKADSLAVSSIDAVFTQGSALVFETTALDRLKQYLVVTATYEDSSTTTIPSDDYELSGTLTVGTSTITASYEEKTDTFSVTVSELPYGITQDLNGYIEIDPDSGNSPVSQVDGFVELYSD